MESPSDCPWKWTCSYGSLRSAVAYPIAFTRNEYITTCNRPIISTPLSCNIGWQKTTEKTPDVTCSCRSTHGVNYTFRCDTRRCVVMLHGSSRCRRHLLSVSLVITAILFRRFVLPYGYDERETWDCNEASCAIDDTNAIQRYLYSVGFPYSAPDTFGPRGRTVAVVRADWLLTRQIRTQFVYACASQRL